MVVLDPQYILIVGIILLFIILVLTVIVALVYSGLLTTVQIKTGSPQIGSVKVAYKYVVGPYSSAGQYFTDVCRIGPLCRPIGVYYDNPDVVPALQLRYIVGMILCEDSGVSDTETESRAISEGYQVVTFPRVTEAVKTTFPYSTFLSIHIAVLRVYPKLGRYLEMNKLNAYPMVEIYDEDCIHFMAPLSRQTEFFVSETSAGAGEPLGTAAVSSETVQSETVSGPTTIAANNGSESSASSFEEM